MINTMLERKMDTRFALEKYTQWVLVDYFFRSSQIRVAQVEAIMTYLF